MAQIEPIELAKYREPGVAGYAGVGAEIRDAREAAGRTLAEVADALRIRPVHLQAIEEGRFDDLPGRVYAIGFLRAYAGFLALDPQQVVSRFRQETAGGAAGPELNFPEPPPQNWRPNIGLFGLALAIVVGAYAAWYMLRTADDLSLQLVAEVPARLLEAATPPAPPSVTVAEAPVEAEADAEAAVAAMADVASAPAEEVTPDPLPRAEDATATARPEPAEDIVEGTGVAAAPPELRLGGAGAGSIVRLAPEPAPADVAGEPAVEIDFGVLDAAAEPEPEPEVTPASEQVTGASPFGADSRPGSATVITGALAATPDAPDLIEDPPPPPAASAAGYEPRVYGQGNADARIVIRARADAWVQVQGANNDLILTRILRPGDVFLVPDRDDLTLVTGNAGGLEVLVDGVPAPPLGTEGSVRRAIRLTPEALASGGTVGQR